VRFRARRAAEEELDAGTEAEETVEEDPRANGPWDASEVDEPEEGRLDLGSLLIRPHDGVELRLQIDEASGALVAVLLAVGDGAVELRPFASAKDVNLWDEGRKQITAQLRQQGATVTERPGEHGVELHVEQPVEAEGKRMVQASRMVGIRGPRWVLRAVFLGRYATDPAPDSALLAALRDVVVVRGSGPLPPGEAIPLHLPPDLQLEQGAVPQG
jgi:hypothetical protein